MTELAIEPTPMPTMVSEEPFCPICGMPVELTEVFTLACSRHGDFQIEDCTWVPLEAWQQSHQ